MTIKRATIPWALALVALAVGCGGDVGPTAPGEISSSSPVNYEGELHALTNSARSDKSMEMLWTDAAIAEVARAHSRAMRDDGFVGHVGPDGRTLADRLQEAGIPFTMASENVVRVPTGPDPAGAAHDWLMHSPPHRANILNPDFDADGVGVVSSGGSVWFTEIFVK